MRIPQATGKRSFRVNQTSPRATQPSTTPSNVRTTGPQGTPGGIGTPRRKPGVAGKMYTPGMEVYLWIVVFVELFLTGALRRYFRRFHGG